MVWSPPLDSTGNSVRGVQFCEVCTHFCLKARFVLNDVLEWNMESDGRWQMALLQYCSYVTTILLHVDRCLLFLYFARSW